MSILQYDRVQYPFDREYDISLDPEEPQQIVSFMPERSHSRSFKGDSSSREVVSFCLGCGKADWGPLTLYALSKSGDVWAICPYLPHNAYVFAKRHSRQNINLFQDDS